MFLMLGRIAVTVRCNQRRSNGRQFHRFSARACMCVCCVYSLMNLSTSWLDVSKAATSVVRVS